MATSVPPEASRNELPLAGEPPAGHLTAWSGRCRPLVTRCRQDNPAEPLAAPDPIQVARPGPGYAVTDHAAQSRTVTAGLAVIIGTEDRQQWT
jgi:hypothetical protein